MLKKLFLFQIIILTLRHNSKVKPRLSGTQNHQRFYLQHKMISIMARIERTYSQEKVKQMLKLNEVLLDYLLRELPSDAVFPSKTDKGMNVLFTPTLKLLLNLPFAFPVPFNHLTCGIRLKIPVAGVHEHVCLGDPIPIMGGT